MYILNVSFGNLYFIANDVADLEEMALSFFEEDWYDFFCYLIEDSEPGTVACKLKREALNCAIQDFAPFYTIHEAIFI